MRANNKAKVIIALVFLSIVFLGALLINSGSGEKIKSTIYSTQFLMTALNKIVPNDLNIAYNGQLVSNNKMVTTDLRYSDHSLSWTISPSASIELLFDGTQLEWIGNTGDRYGIVELYLDQRYVSTIDLYSNPVQINRSLYKSPKLDNRSHTLSIQAIKQKNPNSEGFTITLDHFNIWKDDHLIVVGDDDPNIKYLNSNRDYQLQFVARKLFHFLEYAILTMILLFILSYLRVRRNSVGIITPGIMLLCAIADEYRQSFIPGRYSAWQDIAVDSCGVFVVMIVYWSIRRKKRRIT